MAQISKFTFCEQPVRKDAIPLQHQTRKTII
nr:MAG TPA: hypothetical protein [Caudoviricetes sp.]